MSDIYSVVARMMEGNKGILAADESNGSMNKRLAAVELPQEEHVRREYRELLLGSPNLNEYINGVILYDETMRQKNDEGVSFLKLLEQRGILPGIKVDQGLIDDPDAPGEQLTTGLEGLVKRLQEYKEMGAVFTKWRAVDQVENPISFEVNQANITRTARILSMYAKMVQEADMVPMVEPEVLKQGAHTIEEAEEATHNIIATLFAHLKEAGVDNKGLILKTSMVVAGSDTGEVKDASEVAERTVRVLKETVPSDVGGVVFLSGGQTPLQATRNLQAIAQYGIQDWPVSFSYSRAVQGPVLSFWKGKRERVHEARAIFEHRLKMNTAARAGEYKEELEHELEYERS